MVEQTGLATDTVEVAQGAALTTMGVDSVVTIWGTEAVIAVIVWFGGGVEGEVALVLGVGGVGEAADLYELVYTT